MDSSQDSRSAFKAWLFGLWLAPVLLLVLGILVILFDGLGVASGLGNRLFDAYQRHAARPFADTDGMPVRVLELPAMDEDRLVDITRSLSTQGARMMVFTAPVEASASPQSLSARLPPGSDGVRAALAKLPEPGHELADAIAGTQTVLPVMLGESGRSPHLKARFLYRGTRDPFASVPRFDAASAPPPILESNAAGLAAAKLMPDADGVLRRVALALRVDSLMVPGMAAEVMRLASGRPDITVISNEHDPLSFFSGVGLAGVETPKGLAPTDAQGQIWLRYAADSGQRRLNPNTATAQPLKGAIIVVGLEGDTVQTPLGPASAAQVTAEAIENLLGKTVLQRPGWAPVLEAFLLAGLGAAMIFLLRRGLGWALVLVLAAPAVLGLISWSLYAGRGVLLDWLTPTLFLGLTFLAGAFVWLRDLELSYAGLRLAFADALPRPVLDKIARHPALLKTEGETRAITYLACVLRGQALGQDAASAVTETRKILSPLIELIQAHGGTLDRLGPGGFSAFWNAPLDNPDHAQKACDTANDMAAAVAEMDSIAPPGIPPIEFGVGIASGPVIAGAFGAPGRLGYGVQGAAVALAEKIAALSHRYGFALLAAEDTRYGAERGAAFLEIDSIADSANAPVVLYALMGNSQLRASPKVRALTVFHDHIFQSIRKQNWRVARELIAQCRRLSGANQKLYDLHLARIAYYEKNSPGAEWDGAFREPLE
ncbi:MAG TPA: CHASE2 domain-containing protein [Rhizomicrobium sp.]|nr:CHASE2 domain-containing protein [Rhizomicrobium sp.]